MNAQILGSCFADFSSVVALHIILLYLILTEKATKTEQKGKKQYKKGKTAEILPFYHKATSKNPTF